MQQRRRVAWGAFLGCCWMVGLTLPPYLLSRAIDEGLGSGRRDVVVWWAVVLVVVGALIAWIAILRHRTMTWVRADAAYRTVSVITDQAVKLGATLAHRTRAGEIVAIGVGDAWTIGRSLTVTGPGVGAVLAYVVIAVLLLQVSIPLAVVVLTGVTVLALILGPALGRLQKVGTTYRSQQGALTGRVIDIIAGLSVLNGLGGKDVYAKRFRDESQDLRDQGYRVGAVTSLIQAVGLGLPTLFLAVVVWLAARLAVEGTITVGELVAVYGYVAVLVVPVTSFIEGAVDVSRALVAARRVVAFLALSRDGGATNAVPEDGELLDSVSGLRVAAGEFTAVATARQADAVALVDRLGGYASGATLNGQPLTDLDRAALRERVLVADNDAALFSGPLEEVVSGAGDVDRPRVVEALHTAAAEDVVLGLQGGLTATMDRDGRNVSGGQRQRVRLARAVMADPDVLLAVDPTSAVDAATENTIVQRLKQTRRGRTTLVTSTSALLLAHADQVHLLAGDRVLASGTHASLLRDQPAYAALVFRGEAPPEQRLVEESGLS
jgi:ABC-type multidrug transport system fused ATPase/permease subunit